MGYFDPIKRINTSHTAEALIGAAFIVSCHYNKVFVIIGATYRTGSCSYVLFCSRTSESMTKFIL